MPQGSRGACGARKHLTVRAMALFGLVAVVCLATTSCGHDSSSRTPEGGSVASNAAYTGESHGSSEDDNRLSQKTTRPADPLAPDRVGVVKRPGQKEGRRLKAHTVGFGSTLSYSDGVRLSVQSIDQANVAGQGPGVISGPMTSLRLRLNNSGKTSIALDQVVVTAVYGEPARIARPVYSDDAQDFSGSVKPGGRAGATYAFSVPRAELTDVTVYIDFDSHHAAGVFSGSTITEN